MWQFDATEGLLGDIGPGAITVVGYDLSGDTITQTFETDKKGAFQTFNLDGNKFKNLTRLDIKSDGTMAYDNIALNTAAVPTPSSFAALIGMGLMGLVAVRRRRKK